MMHTLKLKPDLTEKISTVTESKEKAKEEEAEQSRVKGYTDGSGYEGRVGAAVVLYQDAWGGQE